MQEIDITGWTKSGEGGTAVTYKRGNSMAKLYNPGFEADMAIKEFKISRAVFEMGINTPEPIRLVTDGKRTLWIDIGQFCRGVPQWDLGWFWTMCHNLGDRRADFLLHLTQASLNSFWEKFLPVYIGTADAGAIEDYTREILPFYAVRVPYMFSLNNQGQLPEEGCKALMQMF